MYDADLAHLHDHGWTAFARTATRAVLEWLDRRGLRDGLVVDLGCGSGVTAAMLVEAGYDVLGIDVSEPMLALARERAPGARFTHASAFTADIPDGCVAVLAISEVVNYDSDPDRDLDPLFARVHAAVRPGGVFVLDTAGPPRLGGERERRVWTEDLEDGYAILVHDTEDLERETLVKRMTIFRREPDGRYRRTSEVHRQRLYRPASLAERLRAAGFASVQERKSYAGDRFASGHGVLIATR